MILSSLLQDMKENVNEFGAYLNNQAVEVITLTEHLLFGDIKRTPVKVKVRIHNPISKMNKWMVIAFVACSLSLSSAINPAMACMLDIGMTEAHHNVSCINDGLECRASVPKQPDVTKAKVPSSIVNTALTYLSLESTKKH